MAHDKNRMIAEGVVAKWKRKLDIEFLSMEDELVDLIEEALDESNA